MSGQEKQFSKYFQGIQKEKADALTGLSSSIFKPEIFLLQLLWCDRFFEKWSSYWWRIPLLPPSPSPPPLHASLHAYLPSKCEGTRGTGKCWAPVPSPSDLYFWKGPSLLSFRIFLDIDSLFCWNSFTQVKNTWICRAKSTWIFGPKPDTQLPLLYKHPVIVALSELVSIYPFQSHSLFCCLKSPLSLSLPHN